MTASPSATTPRGPGWAGVLVLCIAAFALRIAVFGNPTPLADDQFYALIGARMHEGVLPYIGIWDRKPLGLFAIYWAIAGVSTAPLAWQIAATLCAAATAALIARLADELTGTGRAAGVMAGLCYLASLNPLDGFSGQSPVFYNLPMALAALCAWRDRPAATALLCGLAITVKQTALFESGFLGLWLLWHAPRQPVALLARAATMAALVLAPTLACAGFYAAIGHFDAWWQAMVLANLAKGQLTAHELAGQAASTVVRIVPLLAVAAIGLARMPAGRARRFLGLWGLAAAVGFLSVPHFFGHYALPALVPLSVMAAAVFAGPRAGRPALLGLVLWSFVWFQPWDRAWHLHAIGSANALASVAVQHDHGRGILVFDGPTAIYALSGRPVLSPLVFPHHLNQQAERNVSQYDTDAEVDRVLAGHPGAVVLTLAPRNFPVNWRTWLAVQGYLRANCRLVAVIRTWDERFVTPIAVWGDCAPPPAKHRTAA